MKGLKKKVLAFVLVLVMIIANVMIVAAEGEEIEKYIGVGVDAYGGTFSKLYWNGLQWVSEGEVGEAWSHLLVSDGTLSNAKLWKMEKDPVKAGATFEGWAKFYYQDIDGDEVLDHVFQPKNATAPYYTTDEMFDDKLTDNDVTYAAKWSDVAIEDYYKEYMWEVYEYGENCEFKYWTSEWIEGQDEPVWTELNYGGFSTSAIAGLPVKTELEDELQIREEPKREGSTFEGWARFKQEGHERIFMPKSTTDPYFTTEELFDSIMPEYDVTFAPKWSDMDIEDYYPTYYMTLLHANGGNVYTKITGDSDWGAIGREYRGEAEFVQGTKKQSANDVLQSENRVIQGVNKSGEVFENWTVYEAKDIYEVHFGSEDTLPKDTDTVKYVYYTEYGLDETEKVKVYFCVADYKLISNAVSNEELMNSYKGAHYYAVANWKKSVAHIENQKVTESLTGEGNDLVSKIKELKAEDTSLETVVSKQTVENVKEALQAGKTIQTELVVYPVQETLIEAQEKANIETEASKELGKDTKIQYLDIQVMLKADEEKLGNILKLENKIEITIAIPDDMKAENGKYVVLRNHNGKVDVLDTKLNADSTVTFETDRFSTYALAYVPATSQEVPATPAPEATTPAPEATTPAVEESKPAVKEPTSAPTTQTVPASPKTYDASSIVGYSVLCMMALAVVVWKRKELFAK